MLCITSYMGLDMPPCKVPQANMQGRTEPTCKEGHLPQYWTNFGSMAEL